MKSKGEYMFQICMFLLREIRKKIYNFLVECLKMFSCSTPTKITLVFSNGLENIDYLFKREGIIN